LHCPSASGPGLIGQSGTAVAAELHAASDKNSSRTLYLSKLRKRVPFEAKASKS